MTGRFHGWRLAFPSVLLSVLLLGLCGSMAGYFYYLQAQIAHELNENVFSRKAANNLEEALEDLLSAHSDAPARVPMLQARAEPLIDRIEEYADKPKEIELARRLRGGYESYRKAWHTLPTGAERSKAERAAISTLKDVAFKATLDLRSYNAEQIDISEQQNRVTLQRLAWGLAGVGVAGSVGGLVMGFGLARWYRQGVQRLQVYVRAAAGALGQDLPAVEVTGDDLEQLHDQVQTVVREVETVVRRLQQREREFVRAEQLAAVGQLAAGVAHEVRNPLTSIKMLIETHREEAVARGMPVEDCDLIRDELRRVERSLNGLLDFARPPKPEKSPQNLLRLIEQTISLVQGRAVRQNVRIEFAGASSPAVVEADGGQIQQVLVNLVLNALDAMPAGGVMNIELKYPPGGGVELHVIDSGPGIAGEILPRLFEPFISNKETGLGLGLVTSRRIVEDHGGSLRGENRPDGGARFSVRLPAA